MDEPQEILCALIAVVVTALIIYSAKSKDKQEKKQKPAPQVEKSEIGKSVTNIFYLIVIIIGAVLGIVISAILAPALLPLCILGAVVLILLSAAGAI